MVIVSPSALYFQMNMTHPHRRINIILYPQTPERKSIFQIFSYLYTTIKHYGLPIPILSVQFTI